jgi:hypothetical protein
MFCSRETNRKTRTKLIAGICTHFYYIMTRIIQINGHHFPVEEIAFISSVLTEGRGNDVYLVTERRYVHENTIYRFYVKLKNDFTVWWESKVVSKAHAELAATEKRNTERTRQRIIDFAWSDAETLTISNQ